MLDILPLLLLLSVSSRILQLRVRRSCFSVALMALLLLLIDFSILKALIALVVLVSLRNYF